MDPLVFAGSLLAVLVTAGLVAWLGLGRDERIDDAGRLAEALLADFESAEVFPDASGRAALVRGEDGSWALLRLHGRHPVVRRFASLPRCEAGPEGVRVFSGEWLFGPVTITNDKLLTLM